MRDHKPHRAKTRVATVWMTTMIPQEISDRMRAVIDRANEKRDPSLRYVSKTGFVVAALADALEDAEKGLGIG